MSMPAIFFAASDEAAAAVELNHDLPSADVVELGSVDTLKLSTLWAIIDRRTWDVDSMDSFTEIRATDSEWTHQIPDDLVEKISTLSGAELVRVAAEWAATEEMRCKLPEAKDLIEAIGVAARRALATKRSLFLYTCL